MSQIEFRFARNEVETMSFSRFKDSWSPNLLPTGSALQEHLGNMVFRVEGYDDGLQQLFEIPDARRFFCAFHASWPYWFFACSLATPDLHIMTLCCLPRLLVLRRKSPPFCQVQFHPEDLHNFVLEGFRGMNLMCARAGMSRAENLERSTQIIAYYQTD
jgi:hypothetical protein